MTLAVRTSGKRTKIVKVKPTRPKVRGDVDPLHLLKSIAGFLDQLREQLALEAGDYSVPVSKELMARLESAAKPGTGLTIRGIIERAVNQHLEFAATELPPKRPKVDPRFVPMLPAR